MALVEIMESVFDKGIIGLERDNLKRFEEDSDLISLLKGSDGASINKSILTFDILKELKEIEHPVDLSKSYISALIMARGNRHYPIDFITSLASSYKEAIKVGLDKDSINNLAIAFLRQNDPFQPGYVKYNSLGNFFKAYGKARKLGIEKEKFMEDAVKSLDSYKGRGFLLKIDQQFSKKILNLPETILSMMKKNRWLSEDVVPAYSKIKKWGMDDGSGGYLAFCNGTLELEEIKKQLPMLHSLKKAGITDELGQLYKNAQLQYKPARLREDILPVLKRWRNRREDHTTMILLAQYIMNKGNDETAEYSGLISSYISLVKMGVERDFSYALAANYLKGFLKEDITRWVKIYALPVRDEIFKYLNENMPNAFQVVNNPSVIIQAYDKGVKIDGHFLNALQNEIRKMIYYTTRNTALAIEQKVKELGINPKDDTQQTPK